jgi:hypothetical protein
VATAVLAFAVALTSPAAVFTADPLAMYRLGRGWATFGLALPQGAARGAVAVGTLATQTDVKTRWPDGSIRFAVVTARAPAAGTYPITPASPLAGSSLATWPSALVELTIGPGRWEAALPPAPADGWLAGPLVTEARATVTPDARAGHPFLRVIFDVRAYADGGKRLDVTVEDDRHRAGGEHALRRGITLNGQQVFRKAGIEPQMPLALAARVIDRTRGGGGDRRPPAVHRRQGTAAVSSRHQGPARNVTGPQFESSRPAT